MVLRQKLVKMVCKLPNFGGTVAGSHGTREVGMGWFVAVCVLGPVCSG